MFQKLWRTCFDEESCISHLTGQCADCYTTNQDFHLDSRDVSET